MTRTYRLPAELIHPGTVSLDLYTIRNPEDRVRTYRYPILPNDVPSEYVEDMLAVVKIELSRCEDDLADVRDQRRKVRDLAYASTVALSASLIAMLSQIGKPWQVAWPYWVAFALAFLSQFWSPLVGLHHLSEDESGHRRERWALLKIQAEYEQVLRSSRRHDQ